MVNREVGEFAGKGEMEGKVVEGLQMWPGEEEDGGWPEMGRWRGWRCGGPEAAAAAAA